MGEGFHLGGIMGNPWPGSEANPWVHVNYFAVVIRSSFFIVIAAFLSIFPFISPFESPLAVVRLYVELSNPQQWKTEGWNVEGGAKESSFPATEARLDNVDTSAVASHEGCMNEQLGGRYCSSICFWAHGIILNNIQPVAGDKKAGNRPTPLFLR